MKKNNSQGLGWNIRVFAYPRGGLNSIRLFDWPTFWGNLGAWKQTWGGHFFSPPGVFQILEKTNIGGILVVCVSKFFF